MHFNRCSDDFMGYFVVAHQEKNLTQRAQREEGTEFAEKRTIQGEEGQRDKWEGQSEESFIFGEGQRLNHAGQLHHLNVFWALVPIVAPTDNNVATV